MSTEVLRGVLPSPQGWSGTGGAAPALRAGHDGCQHQVHGPSPVTNAQLSIASDGAHIDPSVTTPGRRQVEAETMTIICTRPKNQ